jgi:hypothetical protein
MPPPNNFLARKLKLQEGQLRETRPEVYTPASGLGACRGILLEIMPLALLGLNFDLIVGLAPR